ncbi:MAG: tetratricopeptide repeat protein, partial [Planctomycetota bacterium]
KLLEKEEGRFRRLALGAGLLAGLNAVLRPNLGLVLPLAAGLIWRRRGLRRNTGWFLGAAVLPLLATTAWNLERSGQFAVTGTNGPMNLFFAYGPDTGPTFDVHDHRWGNPELQAKIAREYAVVKEAIRKKLPPNTPLQPLTNKEASRYWAGEALTWMEAHPEMVLQRILEKFLGVLTWRDLAVILPIDASRGAILILYLLLVPFPLILLLGLFGARRRGGIVSSAVWIGFVPILLGALLFFTYTRFRVPAVPLLALAAGPGFLELRKVRWSGIKIAALVLFAAAFTAATWNPWLGKEARAKHYDKTSVAHGWWQVGIGWYQRYQDALHAGHPQGRMIERSLAALRRSKELQPESPLPDHWIGLITRDNLHDGPRAYSIFRQLVRKYPVTSFPDASAELGVCEVLGLGEGGVPDYARADQLFRQVERNNGMKTVYLPHWAKALKELGRDQEACQKLKEVLQSRILTPRERTRFEKMSRDWGCG